MYLFYSPEIMLPIHTLNEEESRHCNRVLRLSAGDKIFLTDGKGTLCEAVILNSSPKASVVRIVSQSSEYGKRDFNLSIGIAPTKNTERFEWFLEKATEIGIDEIIPLICRFSERKEIKVEG